MKPIAIGLMLLMAAVAVDAQTLLICESKNNVRHTCELDARGRMVTVNQQLSENPCVVGKSWGVNRNRKSIWVDDGCRAEFLVGTATVAHPAFAPRVRCQSINNGRTHCAADTSYGVQLARQISRNGCVRGEDWGFDENGVWVNHGCRADFVLGVRPDSVPMTSSTRTTVVCESQNNTLNRCAADTLFGVALARQMSQNACVRGESWGYDAVGIWVNKGCRAEFVLGQ